MRYFPLFADLRGRRVLVVGGGVVAERKARLLLEAGAEVTLVAPAVTEWLATAHGVTHVVASFEPWQMEGAALAVAATDDPAVNEAVAEAGRARNVLVNVVDDAERSSFIVPAIVDRSPLVIAISSGGVAPVLARHVRERIETLLDASVGVLATLLQRWRTRIKSRWPVVEARRRFYERVVRGPVVAQVRAGRLDAAEAELDAMLAGPHETEGGSVAIVGAGPGDAGLLTLNALRAMQEADVVLHDRLVSNEVLALVRRDATLIPVGKSAAGHSVTQARIHELMLEHAQAGRRVVRLKGGDPFIFGRGGEELEVLREHGIPYEVVPGVTAAIACGAYAGIPLTHRDHAQSVRFITAHCRESLDRLDWESLARERQTLAMYMGVGQLPLIEARLREQGRSPDTPIAIIENGSRTGQQVLLGALADLAAIAESGRVRPPALLVIGEVAGLAERLHWFGRPPERWIAQPRPAVAGAGRTIRQPELPKRAA